MTSVPRPLLYLFMAIVGLGVVWLADRIARTDQAEFRLAVIGVAIVGAVVLLGAGLGLRRR